MGGGGGGPVGRDVDVDCVAGGGGGGVSFRTAVGRDAGRGEENVVGEEGPRVHSQLQPILSCRKS